MERKQKIKKSSLLFKNVLINLVIVIGLIVTIVTILYQLSAREITREIEEQIHLKLESAKDDIENTRTNQEQQLSILSNTSDVEEIMYGHDASNFRNQVDELLESYQFMENVLLIDSTGKVLFDSGNKETSELDLSSRAYFQESIKGNTAHSDILVSQGTGNLIEMVSVPIERSGKVIGVLATSMNIDYIKSVLQEIKVEESGYAFLLDENGNFIYHPNSELINTSMTEAGVLELNEAWPDMQAGKEGVVYYTYDGVKKMTLYLPIGSWTLSINAVKSEYLSAVNAMLQEILIIGFVMLILASGASALNSYLTVKKIKKVQKVMGVVTRGDMTVQVEEQNLKKCWEILNCDKTECPGYKNENLKCWEMSNTLCRGEVQADAIAKIDNCKKCHVFEASEGDELGQMTRSLSVMIKTMRNLIFNISQIAEQLSSSSQELSSASEETTTSAESISERMEEMSSNAQNQTEYVESINLMAHEMNSKLYDSVGKINHMAEEAGIVNQKAKAGEEKIGDTINGMEQIKSHTKKIESVMDELIQQSAEIGNINSMITSIAEETNLLSLNASIEAARAGENGKGFGVVADEIGKLASQSQESAKGISMLIERITESIQSASDLMHTETEFVQEGIQSVQESKTAFEEIAHTVYELVDKMKEVVDFVETVRGSSVSVTEAMEKMAGIIEESGSDVEEITASTEEQTSVSEEIARSATELAQMAEELMKAVSEFKV
ncbi:methyl-accepting chemotaxis protein [Lachnotalea glycerini]|uniref:Methyl-accepting chemotaxis protein n=1 Tax=Lachnotalea glycerini TaxID=1763509 RepID=A0A318EMX1_9FIRM|nr:methyl-accepting chemotaxis protein [Lachnotalea glycerini]PXV85675.1 methyl-accepting chemotaxis protein [Lachnotalea glycerini]